MMNKKKAVIAASLFLFCFLSVIIITGLLKRPAFLHMRSLASQFLLAKTYQQKGYYASAFEVYENILAKHKKRPDICALAQNGIAYVYMQYDAFEKAISAYRITLLNYKNEKGACLVAQTGIADAYMRMGEFDEARKEYQKALEEYKGNPSAKILEVFLEAVPIEAWKEFQDKYEKKIISKIESYFSGYISEKELRSAFENSGRASEGERLIPFLAGVKYQLENKQKEAKEYYLKSMSLSEGKDNLIYNLSSAALKKLNTAD